MLQLKTAINIAELVVGLVVAMALGDYLGHKIGRMRLAVILGGIAVAAIVITWIYSAVVLE